MLIKCSSCGEKISMTWLLLGMPWSRYTCKKCGSVIAGTLVRLVMISVCTGVLGYVLIGVVKGKIDPLLLPLPLVLTLAVMFLSLPMQIKQIEAPAQTDDTEPAGSTKVERCE